MPNLEDAIQLAMEQHRGQTDRSGQPYIGHVLRVMARVRGEAARIVAVLHDTVEDTGLTFEQLRAMGYPQPVVAAIDCLTHREDESYDAMVDRILPNALARAVKLADIEDNVDFRRLERALTDDDLRRFEKYRRAWHRIWQAHHPEQV